MRIAALTLLVTAATTALQAPAVDEDVLQGYLKQLFPSATSFSPKLSDPLPHYKAFHQIPGTDKWETLGFAFWTTEIEPDERGYNGRIHILVGMDVSGVLTSIIVVQHHEPYGRFSIDPPKFAAQYHNKSIREPLKLRQDIDAVSGATHTMTCATRSVRTAARDMAKALLRPEDVK